MTNSSQNSTENPIYFATERLFSALDRLEHNLQNISVGQDRDVLQHQTLLNYQHENAQLLDENDALKEEIVNLNHRYNELQVAAGKVNNKLESTIERLALILEK